MDAEQNKEPVRDAAGIWKELEFEGKELFRLTKGMELKLMEPENPDGRIIATVTDENCETTFADLQRKFEEIRQQFISLKADWERHEDKTRFSNPLKRYRNFLDKSNGIGNYQPIWEGVSKMENELKSVLSANYELKLSIVQKAEQMRNTAGTRTDDWNNLLAEWKQSPFIEKEDNDKLWIRFENARNTFFEKKQEYIEERKEQLMQNLDWKMEVCEQAESWAASEKWQEGTEVFKSLFDRWKDIGHVPSIEKNDELWERFRKARDTFFERKTAHYEVIKKEQEENYQRKLKLVEEAELLKDQTNWKSTSDAFSVLMANWKSIGKVPYEKSEELWHRLQAARDGFYNARRENIKEFKDRLDENLAVKESLIKRAESLQNSSDWTGITKELNRLMADWKKTGAVPREKSDEVWNRFLTARKHFFSRKDADREKRRTSYLKRIDGRIEQTNRFLAKLRSEREEDEMNLKDFRESLENTTGTSAKDEELRVHLKSLIEDLEKRMPSRKQKIQEVEEQLNSLNEAKKNIEKEPQHKKVTPDTEQKITDSEMNSEKQTESNTSGDASGEGD